MSERDELADLIASVTIDTTSGDVLRVHPDGETPVFEGDQRTADALIAAGYRKAERVMEYGTVINRRAAFLTPPAESLEEFKERYVHEGTWMLTERDLIITRTFLRVDPEPSEPVLHEVVAK